MFFNQYLDLVGSSLKSDAATRRTFDRESLKLWTAKNLTNASVSNDPGRNFGTIAAIFCFAAEQMWWRNGRPYYNVWPAITPSLQAFKADSIPLSSYSDAPERVIVLQFPAAGLPLSTDSILDRRSEQPESQVVHIKALMFGIISCDDVANEFASIVGGDPFQGLRGGPVAIVGRVYDGIGRHDILNLVWPGPQRDFSLNDAKGVFDPDLLRMAIGVYLMERDERLFEPDVLKADQAAYDAADGTTREQLAEKAFQKRGQRGWNIGRAIELIPHLRRPHFGIRWTGRGRTIPRLTPISGSVVNRKQLVSAPTGFHGSLGESEHDEI